MVIKSYILQFWLGIKTAGRFNCRFFIPVSQMICQQITAIIKGEQIIWQISMLASIALQDTAKRWIFIQRYFYLAEIGEIADRAGMKEGTVRSVLCRMRKKLRKWLEKEEVYL